VAASHRHPGKRSDEQSSGRQSLGRAENFQSIELLTTEIKNEGVISRKDSSQQTAHERGSLVETFRVLVVDRPRWISWRRW